MLATLSFVNLALLMLSMIPMVSGAASASEYVGVWQGKLGKNVIEACFDGNGRAQYYYLRHQINIELHANGMEWEEVDKGKATGFWRILSSTSDQMRGLWMNTEGGERADINMIRVNISAGALPCDSDEFKGVPKLSNAPVPTHNVWTWVGGSKMANVEGHYEKKGVATVAAFPDMREGSASWVDRQGRFWLFGGFRNDAGEHAGRMNDLWVFDPETGKWTWVGGSNNKNAEGTYGVRGVAAQGNQPGARNNAVAWTDLAGKFWLFGGDGVYTNSNAAWGDLNDLWRFDPDTEQWAWISGCNATRGVYGKPMAPPSFGLLGIAASDNVPAGRWYATGWTDTSGNLWLFGGYGIGQNYNDLWKFNPGSGQWAWMSGSKGPEDAGFYGIRNVPARSNRPGARLSSLGWSDAKGKFWLFGGETIGTPPVVSGSFGDLWKFDPASLQWTWVDGLNAMDSSAYPGHPKMPVVTNQPGARSYSTNWTDASGKFWLFGGINASYETLNDLWQFDPSNSHWARIGGAKVKGAYGVYGTKGVASVENWPGPRRAGLTWRDRKGRLWLLGGIGQDAYGASGYLTDLWVYQP